MATVLGQMFTRGRQPHERLPTEAEDDTSQNSIVELDMDAPSPTAAAAAATTTSGVPPMVVETVHSDEEEDDDERAELTGNSNDLEAGRSNTTTRRMTAEMDDGEDDDHDMTAVLPRRSARQNTVTLAELEEEREMARRRTSACVLLAVFVLFRLWIEALRNGDVFIMVLCLFGTSWTARLIRHNREHEEALDERIRVYLERSEGNTTEIPRDDLRFLSFQAQLALAMMESQRQMQQGGFGHPDGEHGSSAGVSEAAKSRWETFSWKEGMDVSDRSQASNSNHHHQHDGSHSTGLTAPEDYGSTKNSSAVIAGGLEEDGPHCSICLGEYEEGEKLVKLPCDHIYHEDCVGSWTTNHTRCPLCNLDLESVASGETAPNSVPDESIV